jgi:hypothetical protein
MFSHRCSVPCWRVFWNSIIACAGGAMRSPSKLATFHATRSTAPRCAVGVESWFQNDRGIRALSVLCLFALAACVATPSAPAKVADYRGRIGVLCPEQVSPRVPAQAERDKISGKVVADARVVEGAVVDVRIRSGPRVYRNAVVEAMKQYRCDRDVPRAVTNQQFVFDMSRQPIAPSKAAK